MRARDLVRRAKVVLTGRDAPSGPSEATPSPRPAPPRDDQGRRFQLEALEPRVLLSATPFYNASAAAAGVQMALSVEELAGAQLLVLSDAQGQRLASAALGSLSGPVVITGSSFDDVLKLDLGAARDAVSVQFDAGAGQDTLVGDGRDSDWRVTGTNTGTLRAGAAATGLAASFSGVEHLTGAVDNRDVFTLAAAGSLSGGVDGGARGDDAMVFEASTITRAIYEAFGPDSGRITHDSRVTRFAGLEPIIEENTVASREFTARSEADNILLVNNNDGTVTIRSTDATPTFESLTFQAAGTTAITINTGTGADTFTANLGSLALSGGLTVTAGDSVKLGDVALGANLTVTARSAITTTTGAVINAGATGDIKFTVTDTASLNWAANLAGFKDKSTATSITLDSASLTGRDITLNALASTAKLADVKTPVVKDTQAVATGDFNGDGLVDLVQANTNDEELVLFLNNGTSNPYDSTGSQIIGRTAAGGSLGGVLFPSFKPSQLAVGDVDRDGDLDLLVGDDIGQAKLFLNTGARSTPFSTTAPLQLGTTAGSSGEEGTPGKVVGVALADADGDGRLDAFVARSGGTVDAGVQLYLNDGSSQVFSSSAQAIAGSRPASDITSIAVGDISGDGLADVVLGSQARGTAFVINAGGATPFAAQALTSFGVTTEANTKVAVGDLDGDGRGDVIVVGNDNGTTRVWVTPTQSLVLGTEDKDAVTAITLGDVNGDGKKDLVLGRTQTASQVFLNNNLPGLAGANNPFSSTALSVGEASSNKPVSSLALADVNGDGRLDLVQGAARDLTTVYANNGGAVTAGASPFVDGNSSIVNPDNSLISRLDDGALAGFNLFGSVITAKADAAVTLNGVSRINASGNVDVSAKALASVDQTTAGAFVSFSAGVIDSSATVLVGGNSAVVAGGRVSLQADTVNVLNQSVLGLSPGVFNLSVAYGKLNTNASTDVAAGASVQAGSVGIQANNLNTINNSAAGYNFSLGGGTVPFAAGLSIAVGEYSSSALATVAGAVTATGNVSVNASSVDLNDTTKSSASVLNVATKIKNNAVLDKLGIVSALANNLDKAKNPNLTDFADISLSTPDVAIAGAINYANIRHTAQAVLAGTARVQAGGNLDVSARIEDNVHAFAAASASESDEVAIGGAVSVALLDNQATATIAEGARADAAGLMHVVANAVIPNPVNSGFPGLQYTPPADTTGAPNSAAGDRLVNGFNTTQSAVTGVVDQISNGALPAVLGVVLGGAQSVGTSYTVGTGSPKSDGKGSVGGSVNVFNANNTARASIGRNARINQGGLTPLASGQDVWVEATSTNININLAGPTGALSLPSIFSASGKTGIGGNLIVVTQTGSTQAWIDDGALVKAGRDLKVTANSLNQVIAFAARAANAAAVGVVGTVSYTDINQRTEAWVEDGARLDAGRDLQVRSGGTVQMIAVDGALAIGGDVGVGAGIGVNRLDNTVRAFIGDNNNASAALPGSVTVARNLDVGAAARQDLWVLAAAGSASVGQPKVDTTKSADLSSATGQLSALASDIKTNAKNAKMGYAASGAVAVNQVDGRVEAYVKTAGNVRVGGQAQVLADDKTLVIQGGGAFGVGRQAGIGGSAAALDFDRKAYAHVDVNNWTSGALTVKANSDETVVAVAAGAAGAAKEAAVAGSVTVNLLNSDTQAWVAPFSGTASTTVNGALLVDAAHQRREHNVAGALSIGLNTQAAVGAAFAVEVANTTVKAYVGAQAPIAATGNIAVQARNDEEINVVAASLAVSPTQGVGFAGTAAAQQAMNVVQASVDSNLRTPGSVRIDASDRSDRLVVAGGAAGGKEAGVGLSLGYSGLDRMVLARVGAGLSINANGDGTGVADPQGGSYGGNGITLEATSQDDLVLFVAGGAGGGNAGVAASAAVHDIKVRTDAVVGAGSTLRSVSTTGVITSVSIRADDQRDALLIGGAVAGAQQAGVGAVTTTAVIDASTQARVESTAAQRSSVTVGSGNLLVDANTTDALIGVAAGAAGGGQGAGAGSVAVVTRNTTTQAWVGDNAVVDVGGSVRIAADTDLSSTGAAGALAIGGQGGVGASNTTVLDTTVTRAYLGALATVTVRGGTGNAVNVASGQRGADGKKITTPLAGLTISATGRDTIRPLAVGLGGGGQAGVAASVSFTQVDNSTQAFIDRGATVIANQNVNLLATDDTDVLGIGGGAAAGGKAGVGAGADAGTVTKNTRAYLAQPDAAVNRGVSVTAARGDVTIRALSTDQLQSVSAAGGFAGVAGVAGAASVWIVNETTHARINDRAAVTANGNVQVAADAQTQLSQISGSAGAAGSVGVGASVAASTLTKDTLAYVGDQATVTARANSPAIQVATGQFESAGGAIVPSSQTLNPPLATLSFVNPHRFSAGQAVVYQANGGTPINGLVDGETYYVVLTGNAQQLRLARGAEDAAAGRFINLGTVPNAARAQTLLPAGSIALPAVSNADLTASNGTGRLDEILARRSVTPTTSAFSGLAVTATSREAVEAFAASAGGGGAVSVQIAGAGHRTQATTQAVVGLDVKINADNTNAAAGQSVRVLAADNTFHLGAGGSAGVGGSAAVSPGIDAVLIRNTTTATVGDGSVINARLDLQVQALAEENLLTFAIGVAGSGSAAVAGSLAGQWVDNRTSALLGSNAGNGVTTVNVGGNASVVARDVTRDGVIAGAGALGAGGGGFSAAIGLTQITKDTQAQIGRNEVVNALGNSSRTLSTFEPGSAIVSSGLGTQKAFTGVQVAADSSESAFAVGVAGAAGGYVGIAGGASAQLIRSATNATVGDGARINQTNTGAAASQSVVVTATNNVTSFAADGAVGLSVLGGVAGGVDVTVVRNDTNARIGSGAQVGAARDVEVNALARRDITSRAASAAAGSVGLAGGVSVVVIGSALDSQAQGSLTANDGSTAAGTLDQQTRGSQVSTALGGFTAPPAGDSSDAARRLAGLAGTLSSSLGVNTGGTAASVLNGGAAGGTRATIGTGAKLSTGGDLALRAAESDTVTQTVGAAAIGVASAGGAVAVTSIASPVLARVDDVAAGATPTVLAAGGNLVINARQAQGHTGAAYAGAGGLVGALGAQVVVFSDDSDQTATLGQRVQVDRANAVQVQATASRNLNGQATGGAVGGISATGSVVKQSVTGDTLANVGAGATVGRTAGATVGSLLVKAESSTDASADTAALALSVAGGNGADAANTVTTRVQASIDAGARVSTTGNVTVQANSFQNGVATATGGAFGVLQVGVNLASTTVNAVVLSQVGAAADVRAGGNVDISSTAQAQGREAATASSGRLVGGTGVVSTSKLTQTVRAQLDDGAVVRAAGQLRVATDVGTQPVASSTEEGGSFAAAGASQVKVAVTVDNLVRVGIGAATVSGGTTTLAAASSKDYTDAQGNVTTSLNALTARSTLGVAASVDAVVLQETNVLVDEQATVQATGDINLSAVGSTSVSAFASSPARLFPAQFGPVSVNTSVTNRKSVQVSTNAAVETPGLLTMRADGSTAYSNQAEGGLFGVGLSQVANVDGSSEVFTRSGSVLAAGSMAFRATGSTSGDLAANPSTDISSVSIGGALFKFGAHDRRLTVLADGSIAASSNLAASVAADGTVTVANVLPSTPANQPLQVDISTKANAQTTVGGPGGLYVNNVLRSVSMANAGAGNLELGRVTMGLSNTQVAPVVRLNGAVVASPFTVITPPAGPNQGVLRVDATGGAGVTLAGQIIGRGDVEVRTRDALAAGQDIRVAAGVPVTTTAGRIRLQAGDNLLLGAGAGLASPNGDVQLEVDVSNADVGVGGTLDLSLAGNVFGDTVTLSGGSDGDTIQTGRQSLGRSKTAIEGSSGDDQVTIAFLDADPNVTVDLGSGNDRLTLSALAEIRSTGLRLEGGGATDTLTLDNSAGTVATTATLSDTQFSGGGLGSTSAIRLGGLELVNVRQGAGADVLSLGDNNFTRVQVNGGAGADQFFVGLLQPTATALFFGEDGDDRMVLGSASATATGLMSNVRGTTNLIGGAGSDALVIDDRANPNPSGSQITGVTGVGNLRVDGFQLNTAGGARGAAVESLTLNLGLGNDTVNVQSTPVGTLVTINGGPGNDVVRGNLAGVAVNQQAPAAAAAAPVAAATATEGAATALGGLQTAGATAMQVTAPGTAAATAPPAIDQLVFNGGDGIDALNLEDLNNSTATQATITATAVFGTGLGSNGLLYASVENLDVQSGEAGQNINIQSSVAGSTIKLRGTAGNDVFTIAPAAANIVYEAGAGDDVIRIAEPDAKRGLTGKVTVIGGAGNDTLIGSSADDVLFGDGANGEAATDGDDVIIGGLGHDRIDAAGGNDLVFGDRGRISSEGLKRATVETLSDADGGNDHITTGSGDDVVLGGAGNDNIDLGEGRNIGLGDTGMLRYRDGQIERIEGSANRRDGNDTLRAGAGDDLLLGGGGVDNLDAGNGNNLLFADGAELEWSYGQLKEIESEAAPNSAGNVLKAGNGNDLLFGSDRNDRLDGGSGSNRLFAFGGEIDNRRDPALIDWSTRFQANASTTSDSSRQAQWLKRALAGGAGISPWGVSGTANAGLRIDLTTGLDAGAAPVTAASAFTTPGVSKAGS